MLLSDLQVKRPPKKIVCPVTGKKIPGPTLSWVMLKHRQKFCPGGRSHVQITGSSVQRAAMLLGMDTFESTTPCGCDPNICLSLKQRQRFGDPLRPRVISARYLRAYSACLRGLYQTLRKHSVHLRTMELEEVPLRYSGAQKAMYQRSVDMVKRQPIQSVGRISNKWGERCAPDFDPKRGRPRAIIPQYMRDDLTGQFLPGPIAVELPIRLTLEAALHKLRNPSGSRQVASGRSLTQRAQDIKKMFRQGWACVSIDATSFDGSLGQLAVLEREEVFKYAQSLGVASPELKAVLRQQNKLVLSTRSGLIGQLVANRASGTAGTSSGNKTCMLAALMAACTRSYDDGQVEFYCDGDDTLIFLSPALINTFDQPTGKLAESGPCPLFRSWMRRLSQMGLDIKVENIAFAPHEVLFCRSKIVDTVNGPSMVKIPADAFKTQLCVTRHFKGPHFASYLATLREGFSSMWAGVPVMGKLGEIFPEGRVQGELLANGGVERWITLTRGRHAASREITPQARLSFEQTFGIPPDTQIALEKNFSQIGEEMQEAMASFQLLTTPMRLPLIG